MEARLRLMATPDPGRHLYELQAALCILKLLTATYGSAPREMFLQAFPRELWSERGGDDLLDEMQERGLVRITPASTRSRDRVTPLVAPEAWFRTQDLEPEPSPSPKSWPRSVYPRPGQWSVFA